MKFVVDLWLDGYDSEEEMKQACLEFIRESLDFSASSVSVEVTRRPTQRAADLPSAEGGQASLFNLEELQDVSRFGTASG